MISEGNYTPCLSKGREGKGRQRLCMDCVQALNASRWSVEERMGRGGM